MSKVNLSLQVLPVVPEEEIYPVVDRVIEHIRKSGVTYIVGPMETTMEGELEKLLKIVAEVQDICISAGSKRVISIVKIDYKPGGVSIDEKIAKYGR
ncbi:MAG: thiamine-binding protein [Firmicutes bacterium]|nr:thiamine-binding protein [Bacillota bacterium]